MEVYSMIYWKVQYSMWGADGPSYAWFRTKKKAQEFYTTTDYSDPPEKVYIDGRDWLRIKQIESLIDD
jgi:hypothetical protein